MSRGGEVTSAEHIYQLQCTSHLFEFELNRAGTSAGTLATALLLTLLGAIHQSLLASRSALRPLGRSGGFAPEQFLRCFCHGPLGLGLALLASSS